MLVKKGAAASAGYEKDVRVFVMPKGGMMAGASVGGQKFFYRSAVLGRAAGAGDGEGSSAGQPKGASRGKGPGRRGKAVRKTTPGRGRRGAGKAR